MLRKGCMDLLEKRKATHKMKRFLEYKINKRELTGNVTIVANSTSDKKPVKDDINKNAEKKPEEISKSDNQPNEEKDDEEEDFLPISSIEEPVKTDAIPYIYGVATCGLESV